MTMQINTLARAGEPLTVIDAYRAMASFLDHYWERTGKLEGLAGLMGDVSLDIWADGTPGDPASWSDWLAAIDRTK